MTIKQTQQELEEFKKLTRTRISLLSNRIYFIQAELDKEELRKFTSLMISISAFITSLVVLFIVLGGE